MPESNTSIVKHFENYVEKLVDLTARNRLLRYPERAGRIRFLQDVDALGEHGFNYHDFSICWSEADIRTYDEKKNEQEGEPVLLVDEEDGDSWLLRNTELQGEKLIKQLTNFKRDQRRILEEHGFHSLYLAVGTLSWTEEVHTKDGKKAKRFYAPVLLIPLEVVRETKGSIEWDILPKEGQEPEINLALRLYLKRRQNGVNLDFLDIEGVDAKEAGERFVAAFQEVGLDVEYKHEAFIGQFAFSGQHIHEDLKKNQDQFLSHEVVRAICGDAGAVIENETPQIDICDKPDELLKPSEDYSVLNADPSQLKVVAMGVSGRSFVVQGPPGTGKSQTIVNLLTNLAARGKSVLFVCEKRVAMEVVYRRLSERNLAAICLPVFELNRGNKVNIAKTVCDDAAQVSALIKGEAKLEKLLAEREKIRALLGTYAALLSGPIGPLGRSLHWVYTEISREVGDDKTLIIWNPEAHAPFEKTFEEYSRARDLFRGADFSRYQKGFQKRDEFAWIQATVPEALFESMVKKLQLLKETIEHLLDQCSMVGANKLSDLVKAIEGSTGTRFAQVSAIFPAGTDFKLAQKALDACGQVLDQYEKVSAEHPDALELTLSQWIGHAPREISEIGQVTIADVIHFSRTGDSWARILKRSRRAISSSPLLLESRSEILKLYQLSKLDTDLLRSLPIEINDVTIKIIRSHLEKIEMAQARQDAIQETVATTWGIYLAKSGEKILQLKDELALAGNWFFQFTAHLIPHHRKAAASLRSWCLMGQSRPRDLNILARRVHDFQYFEKERNGLETQVATLLNQTSFEKNYVSRVLDVVQKWHAITGSVSLDTSIMAKALEIKSNLELGSVIQILGEQFSWLDSLVEKYPTLGGQVSNSQEIIERGLQLFDCIKETSAHLDGLEDVKNYPNQKTVVAFIDDVRYRDVLNECADQYASQMSIGVTGVQDIRNHASSDKVRMAHEEIKASIGKLTEAGIDYRDATVAMIDELVKLLPTPEFKKDVGRTLEILNKITNEFGASALHEIDGNEIRNLLDTVLDDVVGFADWQAYRAFLERAEKVQLNWLVEKVIELRPDTVFQSFIYSYWWAWLAGAERSGLDILNPHELSEASLKFKELDKQVLDLNHVRILSSICKTGTQGAPSRVLRHEAGKKRQIKPLRTLVSDKETISYLQVAKPIWMMSPSAISAALGSSSTKFDYVVFDESSQLRVEHSLPALARAKQVIAFGDEHQLPPTNFFFASDVQEELEEEMVVFEDILSSLNAIFSVKSRAILNFHYRSRFEELIAFSNSFVYENRLVTSPNPRKSSEAVRFIHVPQGVFVEQVNLLEAQEVAKVCLEEATRHPEQSLGVIAFSRKQEVAIRDAVLNLIRGNADAEILLDEERDVEEPFFIKNLENVQGDERDRIILSVGYGPDKIGGKVAQRFGPLNSKDGYRRLNVAVTRSKIQMICVSSMRAEHVKLDEEGAMRGRMMLRKFLEYAERGISALEAQVGKSHDSETENDFEQTIMNALIARGLVVHPQVGVSSYRIDLGILDPSDETRYILGVECDGATYHSGYSARLNDRLRQEHLESLGWRIYRIWSSDWAERPNEIADEVVELVQSLLLEKERS